MPAPRRRPDEVATTLITRSEQMAQLTEAIERSTRLALDTETHDGRLLDGISAALRVVSLCLEMPDGTEQAFVVDVRDIPQPVCAATFGRIAQADAWNANFDDQVMAMHGAPVRVWRDAMLSDALLHAGLPGFSYYHSLATAARRYLHLDLEGKGTTQTSFDARSDLSDQQIAYAAQDAIVTLWVAREIDREIEVHGLSEVAALEHGARPFILAMMRHGFPFRLDAWQEYLRDHETAIAEVLGRIAELTGGSELTLFGPTGVPTWNVNSEPDLRTALNRYAPNLVYATTGVPVLTKAHPVDKQLLAQMCQTPALLAATPGGTAFDLELLREQAALPQAVLDYRRHGKLLSTYGDNMCRFLREDGRFHPRYTQTLTDTGRLSSDKPNAQNLAPDMKRYIRPSDPNRVLVHADLSQAEQRVLAHLSQAAGLTEALGSGGDVHADTAQRMFGVDMAKLRETDPDAYAKTRKKAKSVAFGIPYGLGPSRLATNLTLETGADVAFDEARALLDAYAKANPEVDKWLSERDKFVAARANAQDEVDWKASFHLYDMFQVVQEARKTHKAANGCYPSLDELTERVAPQVKETPRLHKKWGRPPTKDELAEDLDWVLSFESPVVVCRNGDPFGFESRTVAGRRRLFVVPMDNDRGTSKYAGVVTSAAVKIATTVNPESAPLRDEFAKLHNLDLPSGTDRHDPIQGETDNAYRLRILEVKRREQEAVIKAFEGANKPLKAELVRYMMDARGDKAANWLLGTALTDQTKRLGNAYRNAPIQGLVADIVLDAFGTMWERLGAFPSAVPVQSVHDSVVIECDLDEAPGVAKMVKETLEDAMGKWCPTVKPVADADIRRSADDHDVIAEITSSGQVRWVSQEVAPAATRTEHASAPGPLPAVSVPAVVSSEPTKWEAPPVAARGPQARAADHSYEPAGFSY